jgi:hypothetical protein
MYTLNCKVGSDILNFTPVGLTYVLNFSLKLDQI